MSKPKTKQDSKGSAKAVQILADTAQQAADHFARHERRKRDATTRGRN
ncbi:MAG: hypothetical protein ACHREM_01080 [Polyangiales bacterium]